MLPAPIRTFQKLGPMSLDSTEHYRPSPQAGAALVESAGTDEFAYRQRLKLTLLRRRQLGMAATRHALSAGQLAGHHHGQIRNFQRPSDDFDAGTVAVAEMTVGAELFDDPIHELEELAQSVGRFGQRLRTNGYEMAKRSLDIVLSLLALICLSPVLFVAALIVKLTDAGPVLYGHTRVGLNGREFRCFKFRSMVPNADAIKADLSELNSHSDSRTFKVPNDPRVTRFGRLMRKLSIDELPQLWNVLIGDMSFVGPRPPVPSEVEQYTIDDMERLTVKPGLTCIWQVSGRSRIAFPEQLQMDLDYIDNRSLLLDLKLLALTIPAVISGDGAY